MNKISSILVIFVLILHSCNNDDCNQLCFTPPQGFLFEVVDKTSGENLFTNGTYESGEIKIMNTRNNNSRIDFTFLTENNINLIQVGSIGWETEIVNLNFTIADKHIFDFYVDAERKMGDCCHYTEYKEIKVKDAEFQLNSQTGIYKILVE